MTNPVAFSKLGPPGSDISIPVPSKGIIICAGSPGFSPIIKVASSVGRLKNSFF